MEGEEGAKGTGGREGRENCVIVNFPVKTLNQTSFQRLTLWHVPRDSLDMTP